ncbi:SRPBCC family protein [Mycobacterium sp. MYCO198283]|uniref:SRPBCC family protein n=1 Tax=Mycobacterium sp. MYCO198283 TaxID=2883505 RepID=UPI001E5BB8FA|nr:SRPBCC family protein [Mycobacterium sp. MYCO198283]MCG5433056.1 SRPBCC family protein [Mycobacterium sp. MYCO198283]
MRDSVTVHMAAAPDRIWALISDVTRIGEFSPETFEGRWSKGSDGPAVGARFQGHVKRNGRGPVYWTNCRVTACEPGREFGFDVVGPDDKAINSWHYRLEPTDGGTAVTESFALADRPLLRIYWALLGWARGRTNRNGMRQTLERIKAVVEAPTP